eukprot:IDg12156t1
MVALTLNLLVVSRNLSMTALNISRTSHRVVDSSFEVFVTDYRSLNCCMSTRNGTSQAELHRFKLRVFAHNEHSLNNFAARVRFFNFDIIAMIFARISFFTVRIARTA